MNDVTQEKSGGAMRSCFLGIATFAALSSSCIESTEMPKLSWWQNARDSIVGITVAVRTGGIDSVSACQSTGFFIEDSQGILIVATLHGVLCTPDSAFWGAAITTSKGVDEIVQRVVADAGMIDAVTLRVNSTYQPRNFVRLATADACEGDTVYIGRFMEDSPLFGIVTQVEDDAVLGPRAVAKTSYGNIKQSNSGSPVFNQSGEVVGLIAENTKDHSAMFVPSSVLGSRMISRHDEPINEWWERCWRSGKHALQMAEEFLMKGDYDNCLWTLDNVLEADSLIPEAWHLRGVAASQILTNSPGSEQAQLRRTWLPIIGSSFEKALSIRPHTGSFKGVGDVYYMIMNFDSAIVYYQKALEYDSTNWGAFKQLACSFRYVGDTSQANMLFKVVEKHSLEDAQRMISVFGSIDSFRTSKHLTK